MKWLVLLAACGGESGAPLTCEVLAQPDNCWAVAVGQLQNALPFRNMTLQGRSSCISGDVNFINFDEPLPQTTAEVKHLGFFASNGSTVHFQDTGMNKIILGDVTLSLLLGVYTLDCGDGEVYSANVNDIISCMPPTDGFEVTPTSFSFTLVAPGVPNPLFTCSE